MSTSGAPLRALALHLREPTSTSHRGWRFKQGWTMQGEEGDAGEEMGTRNSKLRKGLKKQEVDQGVRKELETQAEDAGGGHRGTRSGLWR